MLIRWLVFCVVLAAAIVLMHEAQGQAGEAVQARRLIDGDPYRTYGPDDLGVACYQVKGASTTTLSCLQIRPAQPIKPAAPGNGVQS